MFDRFIRLARARKALQEGRFEDAIQLTGDPLIASDRRAEDVRGAARTAVFRRGLERLAAGDLTAAARDLERVLATGPHADAEQRLAEVRRLLAADGERRLAARRTVDEARALAEHGQLAAAEAAVRSAAEQPTLAAGVQALQAFVAARRARAAGHLQAAAARLREGQIDAAIDELRAARTLDASPVSLPWLGELLGAAAERLEAEVGGRIGDWDELAAVANYRARLQALPELAGERAVAAAGRQLADALLRHLRGTISPESEFALLQACVAEPVLPGDGLRLQAAAQVLLRLPALRTGGRTGELATALAEAADRLGCERLRGESDRVRSQVAATQDRLGSARAHAATGELNAARADLLAVLEAWPMHEEARAELESIDRGMQERQQRLQTARQAAKAGRLREAWGLALAHALPGPAGDEARLLGKDIRVRMDLVGRGLDQVRSALHGLESAGSDGLRHCLLRLEELAKVQVDHEEIPQLRSALQAELSALERCDLAQAAIARRRWSELADAVRELVDQRVQFLSPDRLDARILALADRLAQAADEALAGGRLGELEQCAAGLEAAAPVRGELGERAGRLRAAAGRQRERAETLATEARRLLAARDLAGAEERCEAALQLWVDGAPGRKLEDEVRAIRQQEAAVARVEALTHGGDIAGAHDELGELGATPAMLRTRIFDMKQSLARAQGLEGAFLLRVDEGGEYLVLRGESVGIGNVRDGTAELPILAAIAGRHARIQRSMSFHGGMQDTIIAEGGELFVAGAKVASHRLKSGDRVQLGANLRLQYSMPSARSLTACLQLHGGFQVGGTDRVLLLKDRGRDGRILLGPGKDVHVRVPGATGEVEVFAHKTGQIRIRCEGGGQIDGKPFRGEHPVDAGAMVKAAGIGLVLLPWQKTR